MQCPAWHLNFLHFFVFHLTHTTHLNTFQTKYTPSCPINCGSPMDQTSGLQDIPCLISLGSGDFQVKLMPWALHHVPSDIPLKFHCMKGTLFCWGVQLRGWEGVLSLKQCLRGMCQEAFRSMPGSKWWSMLFTSPVGGLSVEADLCQCWGWNATSHETRHFFYKLLFLVFRSPAQSNKYKYR